MTTAAPPQATSKPAPSEHGRVFLQRKCACGRGAGVSGQCSDCAEQKQLSVQPKLEVNEPGDRYEQEADEVAERVMAAPAHPSVTAVPLRIQRVSSQSTAGTSEAPSSVHQALARPGQPMEPALRKDMERRFGHDFSRVRVHTDTAAAESARAVRARAYTAGGDIVFGQGHYAPGTSRGKRLLAHELTHVVQQSKAGPSSRAPGLAPHALQRNADDDLADYGAKELNDYAANNASPYQHVLEALRHWKRKELDDNVAANFTELQALEKLENYASSKQGREMLDALYEAMMTGDVSDFERNQASRIVYAKWKWSPGEQMLAMQFRNSVSF